MLRRQGRSCAWANELDLPTPPIPRAKLAFLPISGRDLYSLTASKEKYQPVHQPDLTVEQNSAISLELTMVPSVVPQRQH